MFRVTDDRPGSQAVVSVPRPGPLRVHAHVRAGGDPADLTGLRVLLIADLLFRSAELGGLQVLATRVFTGEPAGQGAVEDAAQALGIHPATLRASDPAADPAGARPGAAAVVHVADDEAVGPGDGGVLVRIAAARLAGDARPDGAAAGSLGGQDPAAVRYALLSRPRHQPAELTAGQLADAARTLGHWRRQVAGWAEHPSRRIPEAAQAAFRSAVDSLDPVGLLALLAALAADESVPPGARFEALVYADRVLGLDLPRDIGR